jgi:hypothetical protein
MASIRQPAFREGWDQHTMWMVILGELDADEIAERARIREAAGGIARAAHRPMAQDSGLLGPIG